MSTVNLQESLSRPEQFWQPAKRRPEAPPRFHPPTAVERTRFGFISTFPPMRCGLASFTDSLAVGLASMGVLASHVVRACDETDAAAHPNPVPHAVVVGDLVANGSADPRRVDEYLQDCDVVIVQHEFGIFGGPDGEDILPVLEALTIPAIVVLHTVLENPTPHQKFIVERVVALAAVAVVMTVTAQGFLLGNYDVPAPKIYLIPHGVPVQPEPSLSDVVQPGTILTWGLMGPGKGIEWGIMALALLQDSHPDLTYTVIGQTHPKVFEREGHQYRDMLARLSEELGVAQRVIFDDRYMDLTELGSRVRQSDIVLLPYDARNQVTSGVLVEAIAADKKVISTAFPHAVELLSDGVGEVVKHESPRDIAEAIQRLVAEDQPSRTVATGESRHNSNSWPEVAQQFLFLTDTRITRQLSDAK